MNITLARRIDSSPKPSVWWLAEETLAADGRVVCWRQQYITAPVRFGEEAQRVLHTEARVELIRPEVLRAICARGEELLAASAAAIMLFEMGGDASLAATPAIPAPLPLGGPAMPPHYGYPPDMMVERWPNIYTSSSTDPRAQPARQARVDFDDMRRMIDRSGLVDPLKF